MSVDRPTGTVTFVFTDIEGSTALLKELGDGYADVVADHRAAMREEFGQRGGVEVDTQGDSFFFAFESAREAVAAAVAAQRRLAEHPWPEGVAVRVRMSVHTGEPLVGEEGYVGIDVVRAARICSIGHGGQVLLSAATVALVTRYPEGVRVRDLGEVRLKDLDEPEHVHQLDIEGLPAAFPKLRGPDEEPLAFEARLEREVSAYVERTVQDALSTFGNTRGERRASATIQRTVDEALASVRAAPEEQSRLADGLARKGIGLALVATTAAVVMLAIPILVIVLLVRLVF